MYLIVDKLPQQYLIVNKCKFRGGVKLAVLICRAMK